ncbi:hypothetical protein CRUP_025511, partial [Coryphaenoides rupestris]
FQKMANGSLVIHDDNEKNHFSPSEWYPEDVQECAPNKIDIPRHPGMLGSGAVQQNGHTTAEVQEEVALTNMVSTAASEKRHSHVSNDKLQIPRANLNTITTLAAGDRGWAKGAEGGGSEEETVVLVKSLQSREEQLQLDFRREADMFAKLSHANVARLLGVCREAEPHYTIMEYCDLVRARERGGGRHLRMRL